MDGYSHHEQKKQDPQVSKKKGWVMQGGAECSKDVGKGWGEGKSITVAYIYVYIFNSYTLSASNSALCLGYK